MVKVFKEIDKKLTIFSEQENIFDKITENTWVHLDSSNAEEIAKVSSITNIDKDLLLSLLDDEESAHMDNDEDYTLIVFDIPVVEKDIYVTYPFSIIYNDNYFVTLSKTNTKLVENILAKFKKIEPHKHIRLSLQIMYRIASMYIASLKQLDIKRHELERDLKKSLNNDMLLDLMDLNKSLVYFSTSLNANKSVLNRVKRLEKYKKYEQDYDLMEDVEVEINQGIEMCSIYRNITDAMMETFSSIISNNLNVVMKLLAIITLIIEIPTLIASLFGMNVKVPFASNHAGFYIVIAISAVLSIVGGLILSFITKYTKK